MNTYKTELKNPKWQRKRLRIFERDKWQCQSCGDCDSELHAHHTYYAKGKKPWEYPDSDIVTLCFSCHFIHHICENALGIVVPWATADTEKPFEVLILKKIEKRISRSLDDTWHCINLEGKHIATDASCAAMKLSQGKKGLDWIKWAKNFQKTVRDEVEEADRLLHPAETIDKP